MASRYHLPESAAMAAPISGRYLAHNRHDHVAHAFYAGDLVTGKTRLVKPTVTQAAFLSGVNRAYVYWAIKRQAQRAEIEGGSFRSFRRTLAGRPTATRCRSRSSTLSLSISSAQSPGEARTRVRFVDLLRDEFHDATRQAISEIRLDEPNEPPVLSCRNEPETNLNRRP